jgi:hypothetical protein
MVVVLGGLAIEPALGGGRTMEQNVRIFREVTKDDDLALLPSIQIDSLLAAVPVDDRLNADEAFDRPFTDALRAGMAWYLRERGLRVVDQSADLRLTGVIDEYEGFRGWGHWGVDVRLRIKVFRGTEMLFTDTLHALLKYSDEEDVEDEEAPKYLARNEEPARFVEILFTRVGVDLSEKLAELLKERSALLARPAAAGQPADALTAGRGAISVDASVPNAEILLDGHLIGTAPVKGLALPAGAYALEVRKEGYRSWKRDIRVLEGASSSFVAELQPVDSRQPG